MSAEREFLPTTESIAKYVKQNVAKARKSPSMMAMMHHKGGQEIIREDDYKGHHVVVRTSYHITVDGREVTGHIMLTNAGQVQYHGLPNHSFDSTVELVRALIDKFPEDFEGKNSAPGLQERTHMHGGNGGSTSGMKMPGMGRAKPPKPTPKRSSKSKRRGTGSKPQ